MQNVVCDSVDWKCSLAAIRAAVTACVMVVICLMTSNGHTNCNAAWLLQNIISIARKSALWVCLSNCICTSGFCASELACNIHTSRAAMPRCFLEHAKGDRTLMQAKRLADLKWWCDQLTGAALDPLLKTDYPRAGRINIGQNQGDILKVIPTAWPSFPSP